MSPKGWSTRRHRQTSMPTGPQRPLPPRQRSHNITHATHRHQVWGTTNQSRERRPLQYALISRLAAPTRQPQPRAQRGTQTSPDTCTCTASCAAPVRHRRPQHTGGESAGGTVHPGTAPGYRPLSACHYACTRRSSQSWCVVCAGIEICRANSKHLPVYIPVPTSHTHTHTHTGHSVGLPVRCTHGPQVRPRVPRSTASRRLTAARTPPPHPQLSGKQMAPTTCAALQLHTQASQVAV